MTFRWQAVTAKEGAEQPDERWGATFTVFNDSQVPDQQHSHHADRHGNCIQSLHEDNQCSTNILLVKWSLQPVLGSKPIAWDKLTAHFAGLSVWW